VFLWFLRKMSILDLSASLTALIQQTAIRIKDAPAFREQVLRLICHADLGISDLDVSEQQRPFFVSGVLPASSVTGYKPFSSGILSTSPVVSSGAISEGNTGPMISGTVYTTSVAAFSLPPAYTLSTIHRSSGGESVRFNFLEDESNGTQRFFALAGPWLDALDQGALLVIDELDCSMHPKLTRKLVELFQTRDANLNGAQLVFSTHDSTLMDLELFRRDQIWIVDKDGGGASRVSSVYDFDEKPRNNEALQRRYLAGHYGGVPVFGPTFEDLELK